MQTPFGFALHCESPVRACVSRQLAPCSSFPPLNLGCCPCRLLKRNAKKPDLNHSWIRLVNSTVWSPGMWVQNKLVRMTVFSVQAHRMVLKEQGTGTAQQCLLCPQRSFQLKCHRCYLTSFPFSELLRTVDPECRTSSNKHGNVLAGNCCCPSQPSKPIFGRLRKGSGLLILSLIRWLAARY